ISSSYFGVRYLPQGFICDNSGSACYGDEIHYPSFLAMLASKPTFSLLKILNPTLHFQAGNISSLPVWGISSPEIKLNANKAIDIAKEDWDSYETSWDFKRNKLISKGVLRDKYHQSINENNISFNKLKEIEEKNNEHFINSLHISTDELSPVVENDSITLKSNIFHRYGINTPYNEGLSRYRSETIAEMISYSLGCQMGRYSLDREGLVYAHEGNKGFAGLVAEGAYKTFPADSDGILPLMDDEWFDDDVTSRIKEFVRTVWGEEHLQENLEFIAESLCLYAIKPKKGESALETIRRYLSTQFWKDHMKMYKKRPIYWLFSSGKEKAFECLVYLHRYNDATLSRMRTEYVVPLLARYQANIDRLNDQLDEASGGEATRLKRERDSLIKKFSELRSYDDRLRHYADMRISIDLDDGVKVNYGKFGDLLADVKAITGNAPEVI
ncbi:TPA: SAM-dependent methyltransferase, partial [Salmonella enterica subsp. enterica serovar Typhi]|nr:SAM-dependent methyltransferase [Salmonella enterica]